MHGDALIDGAEYGVIAVVARHGEALIAALADAVEAVFRFAEVPAAVQLRDIAAYGRHIADMGSAYPGGSLGQGSVSLLYSLIGSDICQARDRANLEHAALFLDEIKTGYGLEIDHGRGVGGKDIVLERTKEIRTAGDDDRFAA
jgi:hypothetical protein